MFFTPQPLELNNEQTRLPKRDTSAEYLPRYLTPIAQSRLDADMNVTQDSREDGSNYFRRNLRIVDYTLDNAELNVRCPLDNGKHTIQVKRSVGELDLLPAELLDKYSGC